MTPQMLLVAQGAVRKDLDDQIAYHATPEIRHDQPARDERFARWAILLRRMARLLSQAIAAPFHALT